MKKKMVYVMCMVAALGLVACKPVEDKETTVSFETTAEETAEETTAEIPETAEAPETTEAPETQPEKKEPPVVMTDKDKRLTDAELEEYGKYFREYKTWYTQALTSEYDSPKKLNLRELFYIGFDAEGEKPLTDAEKTYLKEQAKSYDENLDTSRLPKAAMDAVLQQYFGISLKETSQAGLEQLAYWAETESYYISRGDTNATKAEMYAGVKRPNGTIVLFYEREGLEGQYYMVTVKPVKDGIQIISNREVPAGK